MSILLKDKGFCKFIKTKSEIMFLSGVEKW